MTSRRLIEEWLPLAILGAESVREGSAAQKPSVNRLHQWWARRPLVASRAAILASIIPADTNRARFVELLGIFGDPVSAQEAVATAKRTGNRTKDPYGYPRAFTYSLTSEDREWLKAETTRAGNSLPTVLDPTAGGGAIPFESVRLGLRTYANDLNPVAALIERATVQWPLQYGAELLKTYENFSARWRTSVGHKLSFAFAQAGLPHTADITYLWARTITCPYCTGRVPLSPHWRLSPSGAGVALHPNVQDGSGSMGRVCVFELVRKSRDHSKGTVRKGDAICPFPDCGRVIEGNEIKRQATVFGLGDQLYAVATKRRVSVKTKAGKPREKWVSDYRAPSAVEEANVTADDSLATTLSEWRELDIAPTESIPEGHKTAEPRRYGMTEWSDLFTPRQLLAHSAGVLALRELAADCRRDGELNSMEVAALAYIGIAMDKMLNYNSRMSIWMPTREIMANTFNRHDLAFAWSFAEMNPLAPGLGLDWAIKATGRCLAELIVLLRAGDTHGEALNGELFATSFVPPPLTLSCRSADDLRDIGSDTIDALVMDPPYYNNVMYAELSDFFYVWLKKSLGPLLPELFLRSLTDKSNEAVANPAKFHDSKGAARLAGRDYQERMAAIFGECRRVLRADGILTVMFTHKGADAWNALTIGLIEAGFAVSASWPVNTESSASLHIRDKSAANSTIFLVCRPRPADHGSDQVHYWEDVEPMVARAVRSRVGEFQKAGIGGVDLYLASFGPALEEFSKHWPLKRGTPAPAPEVRRKRKQKELFEEKWDPYAVSPEDALNAARREVKSWRLEQLTHMKTRVELDPVTSFFVLAWDAFRAPVFPYDEALRLARAVGVDLDKDVIGRLAEKKASNVRMWDSATRAAKHALGSPDGSRNWIDAVHHAAHMARLRTLDAAKEMIENAGIANDPQFIASFEAVLEVLPVGRAFGGDDLEGDLAASGSDFEVLEKLRRLAFSSKIDQPRQLDIFRKTS